ncbi:MAG: 2'-5' RNA ligase family protein [Maribacter sp.]|uniref:2'-5' RNA ligase family protein n=1 Tax=Maribacter sp. TaxID=1897614 RepID=UPI003C784A89
MGNHVSDHHINLYFIALIPHLALREQVKALKKELKERFNASKALRSPAHITLQMPFKRSTQDEPYLIDTLQEFAMVQNKFLVRLAGFDCFSPKVIFVKVLDHKPIISVHTQLRQVLTDKMEFKENELTQNIHPHMTIATRDLSVEAFGKAWGEFEKREFEASFLAQSLFLLKHNGKFWEIYREFLFKS